MYKEYFERLPDIYRQPNNEKIYKVLHNTGYANRMKVLDDVRESKDIDKAYGKTLDLHGENVDAKRPPDMEDEDFRKYIKIKIFANRSNGEIDALNTIADILLDEDFIKLKETWQYDIYNDIAGIIAEIRPNFDKLPQMIGMAKAGGVKLFFETWGKDENIVIEELHSLIIAKYRLSNRTRTDSKKVHAIKENIIVKEGYRVAKHNYPLSGRTKTRSNEGEMLHEDISLEQSYHSTRVKYPITNKAICGGVR